MSLRNDPDTNVKIQSYTFYLFIHKYVNKMKIKKMSWTKATSTRTAKMEDRGSTTDGCSFFVIKRRMDVSEQVQRLLRLLAVHITASKRAFAGEDTVDFADMVDFIKIFRSSLEY